jgi:hypothetical protein
MMRPTRPDRDSHQDSRRIVRRRKVHALDPIPVDRHRSAQVMRALKSRLRADGLEWRQLWDAAFGSLSRREIEAVRAYRQLRTLTEKARPWKGADVLLAQLQGAIDTARTVEAIDEPWRERLRRLYADIRQACPDLAWGAEIIERADRQRAQVSQKTRRKFVSGDVLDLAATRGSDLFGRMEGRVYQAALGAIERSRRALGKEPRGSRTLAAHYTYVYLSLNGPDLYPATAADLIALIVKPSACDRAVVLNADAIRVRFGMARGRRQSRKVAS